MTDGVNTRDLVLLRNFSFYLLFQLHTHDSTPKARSKPSTHISFLSVSSIRFCSNALFDFTIGTKEIYSFMSWPEISTEDEALNERQNSLASVSFSVFGFGYALCQANSGKPMMPTESV